MLSRPEQRGTLAELRAVLAEGVPSADADVGTIAASPLESLADARPRTRLPMTVRLPAGLAAGVLATAAVGWLAPASTPAAVVPAPAAGVAATVAVAALPRLGWLLVALALVAWLAAGGQPGVAAIVGAAALPTAILLRRAGPLWSRAGARRGLRRAGPGRCVAGRGRPGRAALAAGGARRARRLVAGARRGAGR